MENIDAFLTAVRLKILPEQIRTDPDEVSFYAQDWSKTLIPSAQGALFPRSTEEVSWILQSAFQNHVSLVPSGGRTGLSGGAVATQGEFILSLTQMNQVGPIHTGALTLEVQAGAVTESVHTFCASYGLTWPVDFASKGSSTVGGNIATNAGGIRVLRYGNTRNWVLGLTVVDSKGAIHRFNHSLEKNNTGYDFRHLLIGSEGTLGVITEATLKLCPLPSETQVFFFSLPDFPALIRLFENFRSQFKNLSAFECLDHASLEAVIRHFNLPMPVSIPGSVYAIVELEDVPLNAIEGPLEEILKNPNLNDSVMAGNEAEKKRLWKYREGVAEAILHGHKVHQEDVSVPVAKLNEFYGEIEDRYQQVLPGYKTFFFGHIGDGNLHIFIQKPENDDDHSFLDRAKASDLELFKVLKRYNGSVSAEHGIGILKKHALMFSRTPTEINLMKSIKSIFDPQGIMNPGKIFDPSPSRKDQ